MNKVKKISIGSKPSKSISSRLNLADDWVKNRYQGSSDCESLKRLTIDITQNLHRAIKAECALRGTTIAEEIRQILIQKYLKS